MCNNHQCRSAAGTDQQFRNLRLSFMLQVERSSVNDVKDFGFFCLCFLRSKLCCSKHGVVILISCLVLCACVRVCVHVYRVCIIGFCFLVLWIVPFSLVFQCLRPAILSPQPPPAPPSLFGACQSCSETVYITQDVPFSNTLPPPSSRINPPSPFPSQTWNSSYLSVSACLT